MRKFWKSLKSVRLAIGLLATIAAGSLLATLIPQGQDSEAYFKAMPKILAELVTQLGLTRYFSSLLFLLPMLALFLNLGACTIDRFTRELKKKAAHRHGPDILHVGLLVLIAGSLMSFSGRQEGTVRLAPGESVELPGGETLNLVSFDFHQYEDGRPKDWVSKVTVTKGGMPVKPETEIRVNRPLRLGSLTLYQSSYSQDFALAVTAPDGTETRVARGGSYKAEGLDLFYMTTEPVQGGGMQIVARVKSAAGASALRVPKEGVQIGAFRAALLPSLSTGLEAVVDPGYLVVLVALALVGLGTALTFIQKLKDMHE